LHICFLNLYFGSRFHSHHVVVPLFFEAVLLFCFMYIGVGMVLKL
jgi:hypothetical protein